MIILQHRFIITYVTTLFTIYSMLFLTCLQSQVSLRSSSSIESRLLLLYSSPSTPLPASSMSNITVPFNTTFVGQPNIAIGNAGYTSMDQLYNQLWSIKYTLNVGWTGIEVNVRIQTNTKIRILYISYFAVDSNFLSGCIVIIPVEYAIAQLTNTSTGSGSRTDTLLYPITSSSISTSAILTHITNTLYMHNAANYAFYVSCSLVIDYNVSTIYDASLNSSTISNISYVSNIKIAINSQGNNTLDKIGLYIVVVNKNRINGINYYQVFMGTVGVNSSNSLLVIYDLNVNSTSINSIPASVSVSNIDTANVFMAFTNWGSNPALGSSFSWNIYTVANTTNSSNVNGTQAMSISNPNLVGFINYNYFIFGIVDCVYWSVRYQICVSGCVLGETDGSDKGICRVCSSACSACTTTTTNCTACSTNYFLVNTTCWRCNSSVLLSQCGYVPPTPVPNNTNNTNNTTDNSTNTVNTVFPPYWLASLSVIPIIAVTVYFYCRYKRLQTIVIADKAPSFRQFPSIQF